ncbi:thioredoxin fold domain-containing protein [Epilithonimonas sp. JDS]|uniref:thioredoxin family protein n=1 Tax=Epilithonimonas sp. JDS TaxID=2902797 RepID=UPI001E36D7C9|nr:thioredoxin fold domain-containing protein [Epilithonimonas sp. JDS]MCD9854959.1 thioredoxin fold domain-containing protein [Epilithonimonas sp. JDS]
MQKISFFFLIFAIQLGFSQQNIKFEDSDFTTLLAKAKTEKKLIFLDAYAAWCGPCKLMERNVFTDAKVADYYNKNFINAHFDMEKGEGVALAAKYGIRSYPTLLFLNGEGEIVGKELGYLKTEEFLALGKKNNKPELVNTNLKDEFQKGKLDQPALLNFISLYASKDPIIAKQASEKYFANKKDKTFTGEEINALLNFTQSVDDANYKVFQQNKSAIVELLTEKNYTQFDNYLKLMKLVTSATDDKTKTIDDAKVLKEGEGLLPKEDLAKSLNIYKLNYYISHENFPAYEKTALEYYKNPDEFNNSELLAAASVFADKVSTKTSLQSAARWAEKVVMSSENYDSTSILATLYDKLGKKDEAKMFAGMAANFAKEESKDATKMNKILNKK